jgi:DNA topoisomerase IA
MRRSLSTLRDRAYVRMERNRFVPEDKGRIVTAFLTSFFKRYVEYDFTADLEEKLDESRPANSRGSNCCAISGRASTPRPRSRRVSNSPM